MKTGPIIFIDDDAEDFDLMLDALSELNITNELKWFKSCDDATDYLISTHDRPFLILCDIDFPQTTGIEFKRRIDETPELRRKSIPFVFYATVATKQRIDEAFINLMVQGFFRKSRSFGEMKDELRLMFDYWQKCLHPNT